MPRPTGDRWPSPAPKTTPRGGRHTRPPLRRRRRRRAPRRRDCERVKRFCRAVSVALLARRVFFAEFDSHGLNPTWFILLLSTSRFGALVQQLHYELLSSNNISQYNIVQYSLYYVLWRIFPIQVSLAPIHYNMANGYIIGRCLSTFLAVWRARTKTKTVFKVYSSKPIIK